MDKTKKKILIALSSNHSSLSFVIILLAFYYNIYDSLAQENPHKRLHLACEMCHVSTSWTDIRFNHNRTKFPLEDRHQEEECTSCHNVENFSQVSSDCNSCHQDVHQAKMGNDCERCHTLQGWEIFNTEEIHSNSQFPLMGRHSLVDCQSCHQNQQQGDFALLTTDCISCHQAQYLETENPNHVAGSFSTTCQECHDMNNWQPAFLPDHDAFFPIFSGEHDGAWSDCAECHLSPVSFSDFSCLNCHEHNQPKMDEKHKGFTGYAYESNTCLSCHPTGSEADISENHDADFFPIFSGSHQGEWQECSECHVSPGTFNVVSCIDCHKHEQSKMDSKHSGITGYLYTTENCLLCHPSGEKGEFRDHDNLYFPIFAGTHQGEWAECASCHVNPGDRKAYSCLDCHEHSQSTMDTKHAGIQG
ncbi:MAG: cytochrome c3 family protein, partial [bacterium]